MKKTVIMPIIMSLAAMLIHTAPSQEAIHSAIAGIHTKTFAVDNFYQKRLNTTEWDGLVAKIYDLVKGHYEVVQKSKTGLFGSLSKSRSSTVKRSQSLIKDYEKIKAANDTMVNTIKIAYAELSGAQGQKDPELIEQFSKKFESINKSMETLIQELEKEQSTLKNTIKNESSEDKKELLESQEQIVSVLHRLSLTLAITANKARKDLTK